MFIFKRLIYIILLATITLKVANALVRYEDKHPKTREISIAGFVDYEPFGKIERHDNQLGGQFITVYQPMIDAIVAENKFKVIYETSNKPYKEIAKDVRGGKIDMIIGAYYETEIYKGLDLVFPSILSNPVTVFMMPNRIKDVDNMEDLKKLKGVRSSKEYYSDFVVEQLKAYNIEVVDSSYAMFEKLFTRQADYILAGQYYGLIEASKLGLRSQISIAKQTLWKMPLFIGVSKVSKNRKILMQKITHYSEVPKNQEIIKNNLIKMINDFDKANIGVVPPTFGLEK